MFSSLGYRNNFRPAVQLASTQKKMFPKISFTTGKFFLVFSFIVGIAVPLHGTIIDATPIYAQTAGRSIAVVGVSGATLRAAPSGSSLATWASGKAVVARSRTADSQWILVQSSDGTSGWVDANSLVIFGVNKLPVGTDSGEAATGQAASPQSGSANGTASTSTVSKNSASTSSALTLTAAGERLTVKINSNGRGLNVRSGPGRAYPIIGSLADNSVAIAVGRNASGEWYKLLVSTIGSGSGWVSKRYLDLGPNASLADERLTVVSTPALPVRPTPIHPTPIHPTSVQRATSVLLPVSQSLTVSVHPQPVVPALVNSGTGLTGTLVFQTSLGGVFHAYDLQSGRTWPLTYGFDAEISPDGQRVAFVRTGGANGLYIIDITGQNERQIFSDRQWLASPKWSPSGNEIVFSYYDGNDQCQRGDDCDNQRREYRLSVVDTNGNNYRDLATIDSARAPDWNQGGIVYQSGDGIQITEDKHKAENRLVTFDYLQPQYHDPDWQPNSGKIAFMVQHSSHWQIYTVYPGGSGQAAITRPLTSLVDTLPSSVAPAYSPDGNHIVYVSNRGVDENAGDWGIWVMNADGTNQRKLPINMAINYTFGDEQAVSWGP